MGSTDDVVEIDDLNENEDSSDISQEYKINETLYYNIAPITLIITNYVIMPMLIETTSKHMGFKLYSMMHKANFIKYYIFFTFNQLIIPMFGLTSYASLFTYLYGTDSQTIVVVALQTAPFFMRYVFGLTLFSNTLQALDISNTFNKILAKISAYCMPNW